MLTRTLSLVKYASNITKPTLYVTSNRFSSFLSSKTLDEVKDCKITYDITQSPEEWKFVERLLPPLVVPTPQPKKDYSSEWKPQSDKVSTPYFVNRTKNHMMPVYLSITHRGLRRITKLRRIQGDIWQLEKELKEFLEDYHEKKVALQVNEFAGYIHIKGDHVNLVKQFLSAKGL